MRARERGWKRKGERIGRRGKAGPGDTRARGIAAQGAAGRDHAVEGESTAAKEDMRGLSTEDSTAGKRADTLEGKRREQDDEEDGEEGAPREEDN